MVDLNQYREYVGDIREYAKENGLSDEETDEIFERCFTALETRISNKISDILKVIKAVITVIFSIFICLIFLYNHPSTHRIFLRNVQHYIYPGLKVFRQLAVPIITRYPSLTELYDEWCLLENPYFKVPDMDCWPCSTIHSVPDMSGWNMTKTFNVGTPFTRVENDSNVDFGTIVKTYKSYVEVFDEDASRITSNDPSRKKIGDLTEKRLDRNPSPNRDTHISWRINRMKPARLIRKLFPRPVGTPSWWGQSTERFIFMDEPKAPPYPLPNSECSNIILRCTSGSRLIKMVPSPECQQSCKTFAVVLSSQQTLWYNWWYWRPVSMAIGNLTEISILYLTSFC